MELVVRPLGAPALADGAVEIVERKGTGHPDSICDALAEEVSLALSRHYLERFDRVLHHNVDKVLLVGGSARPAFGGGAMLEPISIIVAGRATHALGGVSVPVEELAVEACRRWLREHVRHLDAERDVEIRPRIRSGSAELVALFGRGAGAATRLANDTSCGVGFAPLDEVETIVLRVEQALNAAETKRAHPAIGEDVKVMAVRNGRRIALTVACALVGRHLPDLEAYEKERSFVAQGAAEIARAVSSCEVGVEVNAADDPKRGDVYLTVTGTSAEAGDDGEAGRGNRVNGLITPYRPMTMESVAGKNPVTHVGKIYNLLAGLVADAVVSGEPEVAEAECTLVSRIGHPVSEPQLVDLRLRGAPGCDFESLARRAGERARAQVRDVEALTADLLDGRLALDRWPLRS